MESLASSQQPRNEAKQKVSELERKIRRMTSQNEAMHVSLNYLLNKLKNYIDNHKQISRGLLAIYEEAKVLQKDFDHDDEELRRLEQLKEMEQKEDNFSRVSMDSYHYSGSKDNKEVPERKITEEQLRGVSFKDSFWFCPCSNNKSKDLNHVRTNSRNPCKQEVNDDVGPFEQLTLLKGKSYQKPTSGQKTSEIDSRSSSYDRTQIKFLRGLKNSAVGLSFENIGNVLKRANEPPHLIISEMKFLNRSRENFGSWAPIDEQTTNQIKRSKTSVEEVKQEDDETHPRISGSGINNIQAQNFELNLNPIKESIEEPSPRKRKSDKSNKQFTSKLFENFIIIGADPLELAAATDTELKSNRFSPKILYDFDAYTLENKIDEEKDFYHVLPSFCFPFGIGGKKIHSEKRHQIITMNYNIDEAIDEDRERYFMVAFGDKNTYNLKKGTKILDEINPLHIVYGVSLLVDDYFCKELDFDRITTTVLTKIKVKRDEIFLKEFLKTQNVMYFIQKHYGC